MLEDLRGDRLRKLKKLLEARINPYPARTKRGDSIRSVRADFKKRMRAGGKISLVGRLLAIRDQGKVVFADLVDGTGRIQAVFKKDSLDNFSFFESVIDRGDFVAVTGKLFVTKKKEESIEVTRMQMLSKSLLPLPTEWYGIEETELRLRRRYLDLLLHPGTRDLFVKKAAFWEGFREYLKKEGFLEVETPVFELTPGGAEAEPFQTHHNALDMDFYLRISLELPLKKLLVGGFESVFEIGRIFRNEGIDREHLQDYTQLEFYWAYHDYNDVMALAEKMYKSVIKKVTGKLVTTYGTHKINWGKKWPKVNYVEVFRKANNNLDPATAPREDLYRRAVTLGLTPEEHYGRGRLIDIIYKKTVRPTLIQPCFLVDPPADIEPLAKRSQENPDLVERMQVVACGTELGKGFSELNDPIDQRARFEEQVKLREAGDKEAQMLDEEYLTALEYGMPPAGGFGVSERLFSVLMDKPVRETVFFPLMKPKQ